MSTLIDPYKMWEDGDLTDQAFINLLQARSKYQLSVYGKPNAKDDMRMGCPARADGAEITCPLVPRSEEGKKAKGFQKEALSEDEVPNPGSCRKVCRQRTVTIKNTVEDGAKFLQHGPAFTSAGWRKEYGRRNTIESRNSMLKRQLPGCRRPNDAHDAWLGRAAFCRRDGVRRCQYQDARHVLLAEGQEDFAEADASAAD